MRLRIVTASFLLSVIASLLLPSFSHAEALQKPLRLDPFSQLTATEDNAPNTLPNSEAPQSRILNIDLDEMLAEQSSVLDAVSQPGITLLKVVDYRDHMQLKIDSISRFKLGKTQIDAINHGISLKFRTEILLTEGSSFLGIPYQRTRKHVRYHTELTSFGLNRQYVLFNNRNDKRQRFSSIERALETMGTLEDFEIASLKELHPTQKYRLRVRIYLDYWALPSPLLLDALLDPTWRLDSDWFEVNLTTPLSWQ
ncbi:hypothetical protein THMIRHAS_02480 [Thiosulfatimonas sediminis]|uniref:DUF4390 domain-containing protein n=1 Tax=Thiosulfatimonas sediminis TaxID=2675054 RepID=A0A6F8PRY1_9GAMM|nr:DUF4390 domain-containing protein [Thiosulfatimonas sediminis]BBP44875.1 hypothetical protein THMIRHAS_02480 [Thiosulfatimonas sediminis]